MSIGDCVFPTPHAAKVGSIFPQAEGPVLPSYVQCAPCSAAAIGRIGAIDSETASSNRPTIVMRTPRRADRLERDVGVQAESRDGVVCLALLVAAQIDLVDPDLRLVVPDPEAEILDEVPVEVHPGVVLAAVVAADLD